MAFDNGTFYEPPLIDILEVLVEKGVAVSGDAGGNIDNMPWG